MNGTAIKLKHWGLRYYLWIAIGLLILAVTGGVFMEEERWEVWVGVLAVPAAFLVAAQTQRREELELFRQLFREFNDRYDRMNEKLYDVLEGPEDAAFSARERKVLFDYFNLCGEEYLYYAQGYIYPEVWTTWKHGMLIFRKNRRIKKLWDDELKTDSYYGLAFDDAKVEDEGAKISSDDPEREKSGDKDMRKAA